MLKSISCDKFLSYGSMRKPIIFNKGLNTILGSKSGKNSIGKSTFLMIIDFVFGGDDYLNKKTKNVINNIGHHIINFEFQFGSENLYFSRSTNSPNEINVCDNNYTVKKIITLKSYNSLLTEKYGLTNNDITLRSAVGRFFRIYHRETNNENKPLRSFEKEKESEGILVLLKLFNLYYDIENQKKAKDLALDKKNTLYKAQKYSQIKAVSSAKEYKQNQKKIIEFEKNLNEFMDEIDNGLTELDIIQGQEMLKLKNQINSLRREKTQLISKLSSYNDDKIFTQKNFKYSYDNLKEFFPNANYKYINDLETFHINLTKILNKEYEDSTNQIKLFLSIINDKIDLLKNKIKQINDAPTVSKAILIKFAELSNNIALLQEANKNYDNLQKLKKEAKEEKEKYENLLKNKLIEVTNLINSNIELLNNIIYKDKIISPKIEITDSNHYSLYTPNDDGTGSQFRGLILLDLTILNMTNLPAIIHDSIILKNIEDFALEHIIKLYSISSKQIFIAFDRDITYSDEMRKILNDTKVIELSEDGNELFGRSWNKKK